ncbi:MAG: hypothetical protein WC343_06345 [Bacilli bacterium]|jgi:hypothetical protein
MDFNDVVANRLGNIKAVLETKGEEYGRDNDRYHNFNVASRLLGTSPERALIGMEIKHRVSIMDLIDLAETYPERLSYVLINEKIGDAINYLILLEGLLYNRVLNKKPQIKDRYIQGEGCANH